MNGKYSERGAALGHAMTMLIAYRELIGEYGMLTRPLGLNDGTSVSSFPASVAILARSKYARDDKPAVAADAEAKLLRARGILGAVSNNYLGGSSPLSPEDRSRLEQELARSRELFNRTVGMNEALTTREKEGLLF